MIKIPKLKQGDLIEVYWFDHWTDLGWQDKEEALTRVPPLTKSVGYYIGHKKEYICISATQDHNGLINSVQYRLIPDITKIRKLK